MPTIVARGLGKNQFSKLKKRRDKESHNILQINIGA